jgi:ankyrin repeat protein
MIAAEANGNPQVVRALLEAGADASLKSSDGSTASDYAARNKNVKGTPVYWELNNRRF